MMNIPRSTRRSFLIRSAAAIGFPTIVPSTLFGQSAPSNQIQVAQLGCGRIARSSEFPGILRHHNLARFVAVSDVDTVRLSDAKELLDQRYTQMLGAGKFAPVKTYEDYREMLADTSIDAVCISTPDHWHAQPAMEAALAGKDIYLQKPASLTIAEGRHMADTLSRTNRILQLGSQQRSSLQFRLACELVRNGRIGALREIYIGLPIDPGGEVEREMPVPKNLNYERWVGSTPMVYYTEKRVHPQSADIRARYDRPGWLRCEQFGAGMITGWGTHHIDIAHWAMNTELSGPVSADAIALFPKSGLWDVHGPYQVKMTYGNGVAVYISDKYPNGVKFVGDDGWLWVTRGNYRAGEPAPGTRSKVLDSSNPEILRAGIKENEIRLHASPNNDHHLDWLTSIRTRKPPVTNAEIGHRSCSACLVAHAAMRTGWELKWDPKTERFVGDDAASEMLARPQRPPYGTTRVKG
jgi:predicted dehydrogenase